MILPGKVAVKAGAQRHPEGASWARAERAVLTVILLGDRMSGARRTGCQLLQLARLRAHRLSGATGKIGGGGCGRPPRPEARLVEGAAEPAAFRPRGFDLCPAAAVRSFHPRVIFSPSLAARSMAAAGPGRCAP